MATLTSEWQYIARSARLAPQSGKNYGYYVLLYAKTSANQSTGKHTVTIREILACNAESRFYEYSSEYSGTINGSSAFSGTNKPWVDWNFSDLKAGSYTYPRWIIIEEGSVTVDCTDGVAHDIEISCRWKMKASGTTYTPAQNATGTATATVTLAAIPRKSTVTATDANIGSATTITINRVQTGYTHTLSYKMAGDSSYTTIVSKTDLTSYGWTVPTAAYAKIPNAKTIQITIQCETFNGSTSMGTTTCTFTATAAESNCKPSVSVQAADINENTVALTGDNKTFIKYHSDVQVTTTATARNSATITGKSVKIGDKTGSGSPVTIEAVESAAVTATATDSRGYSNSATAEGTTLIDYIIPTIAFTAARPNPTANTVNIDAKGIWFNGSFGRETNAIEIKARYRETDSSEWSAYTSLTVTSDGNSYTATGTLTGVSYTKSYVVQVGAFDAIYGQFETARSSSHTVAKGIPLFDWGEDNFNFNIPPLLAGVPLVDANFTEKWAQFASGLLIQWGTSNVAANTAQGEVTFNKSFTQIQAAYCQNNYSNTKTVIISTSGLSNGSFKANVYDVSTKTVPTVQTFFYWLAIGKG